LVVTFEPAGEDVVVMHIDSGNVTATAGAAGLSAVVMDGDNAIDAATGVPLCSGCAPGETPLGYHSVSLSASTFSHRINNLVPGHAYSVRVSAKNDRGIGTELYATCAANTPQVYCQLRPSGAFIMPTLRPGKPTDVAVAVQNGISDELVVTYNPPASDGGSEVLSYRIEWSESATFNVASKKEVDCSNNRAKEIVTIATQTTTSLSSATRFELTVTHNGVAATTLPIRTDAIALRENEESELQSGVSAMGRTRRAPATRLPSLTRAPSRATWSTCPTLVPSQYLARRLRSLASTRGL
jgi:hypothetical protein